MMVSVNRQQPVMATPVVVQSQPAQMQSNVNPGMDCMDCMECGGGCGRVFPTMSYFSISGLLIIFGLIHIGVGIAASVLISDCPTGVAAFACSFNFTMISTLIGTGVLYTVAGSLGTCAACCMTGHVRNGLKVGFMVVSIFSAIVVIGSLASLSTVLAQGATISDEMVALSAIGVVGGVIVFLLTVTGSSIACCCSPVSETDGMVY